MSRKKWSVAASVLLTGAVAASLVGAAPAFAGNASSTLDSDHEANWTVPTTPMTNTVELNGTTYKVITTWQNAWGTSGADYLGISNSSILNSAGSAGSSGVKTDLTDAQNSTMLGVWASEANEVPNAYNWNSFYQFYVDVNGEGPDGGTGAPFTCVYTTDYDSASGVCGPFKYRPELVGSSRLSYQQESTAIEQINNGEYYQSDGTYTNTTQTTDEAVTTANKIESADSEGYADALAAANAAFDAEGYEDATSETATASLKSSELRTETASNSKLTADQYASYQSATKDAPATYTAGSDSTLDSLYSAAISGAKITDASDATGVTYYVASERGRQTTYTITFTLAYADYTTTFEYSFKTSTATSDYYIDGDESYDPYRFAYNNSTPFTFLDSFHQVANGAEKVISDFSNYTGTATDWKGMNSLPRATRYEQVGLSADDCATNVEKAVRGSIYYTLAKIADGTTTKKTVAFLYDSPDSDSSTAKIIVFDYIDTIGGTGSSDNGFAGATPLVVNQLGADDYAKGSSAENQWTTSQVSSASMNTSVKYDYSVAGKSTTCVMHTADVSADYLASADVIECLNGSMTAAQLQSWMNEKCTSDANKTAAAGIKYLTNPGTVMSSANYTSEKLLNTLYTISCVYPDLYPNLSLVAYWYDEIYHLNTDSVAQALQWGFSTATMPEGTELSDLGSDYSKDSLEQQFLAGYNYYATEAAKGTSSSDEVIARLSANKGLDGSTSYTVNGKTTDFVFEDWKASDSYAAWAKALNDSQTVSSLTEQLTEAQSQLAAAQDALAKAQEENASNTSNLQSQVDNLTSQVSDLQSQLTAANAKKTNTLSVAKSKVTVKKGKTAKVAVKNPVGNVTVKSSKKKVATASVVNGKVVIKGVKKGKATVTVKAAGNSTYKSATKKITVTVKK